MKTLTAVFLSAALLSACTPSNNYYYQTSSASLASAFKKVDVTKDTAEAKEARNYATAEILENLSPDTCSFNQLLNAYQCDEDAIADNINPQVAKVRTQLDALIKGHGFSSATAYKEMSGKIILTNLYRCKHILSAKSNSTKALYCETQLPNHLIDGLKINGTLWHLDKAYTAAFKYNIIK